MYVFTPRVQGVWVRMSVWKIFNLCMSLQQVWCTIKKKKSLQILLADSSLHPFRWLFIVVTSTHKHLKHVCDREVVPLMKCLVLQSPRDAVVLIRATKRCKGCTKKKKKFTCFGIYFCMLLFTLREESPLTTFGSFSTSPNQPRTYQCKFSNKSLLIVIVNLIAQSPLPPPLSTAERKKYLGWCFCVQSASFSTLT